MEYLSKHWLDPAQKLKLWWQNQSLQKLQMNMDDNLKIFKWNYLSSHNIESSKNVNLNFDDQVKFQSPRWN